MGETKLSHFFEVDFPVALMNKETGLVEASIKQVKIVNILIPYLIPDH